MFTAIFLGLLAYAIHRLFFNLEDAYVYGSMDATFKDPQWVKKVLLMVAIPLGAAILFYTFFKSKIKFK